MYGTILIACSSFVVFTTIPYSIIIGELAIICINQFIESKNRAIKAISIVLVGFCLGFYPWFDTGEIIAFRNLMFFTYIALVIWLIRDKKQAIKFGILDKVWIPLYVISAILIMFLLLATNDTSVMSEYSSNNGLAHLFSYGYSMFLPFVKFDGQYVYSSFLSIFPLSLILAMMYLYKKEKHVNFLMPMILVSVIQSVFCMTKLQVFNFIGWKTTWSMSAVSASIGLSSIYLYMYMIANVEEEIFKLKDSIKIVLALLVFYFIIPRPEVFMSKGFMYGLAVVLTFLYFMFINFSDKRYQKVLLVLLVIWSLISTVPVLFI